MRSARKYWSLIPALGALLSLCVAAGPRALNQSGLTDDPASLRKILVTQPDYTAVETSVILNPEEGFGGKSKVAKMGSRSREETDDAIFIREPGKPTIKIYPKRREYSEVPAEKPDDFPTSAEELAKRPDVTFKLAGAEKSGEYNCEKIQASYKSRGVEVGYIFFVAPELKNLIVKEVISLGPLSFVTVLENVSFDVSEELFRLSAGYKKIVEPVSGDPAKELLDELKKPVRRHAGSTSKRRRHN